MHISDLTDILKKASIIVPKACSINHHEGKKGGYLCIATHNGTIETIALIGTVSDPAKAKKYFDFCQEKALRLASNRDHVSSWESKDRARDLRGGAIRCRDHILSFAGLPELWDEACVLAIGYIGPTRIITNEQVEHICRISENNHTRRLIAACSTDSVVLRTRT